MTRKRQSSSASAASSVSTRSTPNTSPAISNQNLLSPILRSNELPNLDQQLHEDGKPKRPMNVFLVYSRWRRESGNLEKDFDGTPRSEWSTRLGREWKTLPAEERRKWQDHYDQLRKRFDQLFPDYIYTRTSRRQSTGSSPTTSKSKKSKSSVSTNRTEKDRRGDSFSPPKRTWSSLTVVRKTRRRVSAPEYREVSPDRDTGEESSLSEEENHVDEDDDDDDDDDEYNDDQDGDYEEDEDHMNEKKISTSTSKSSFTSIGLGLSGMGSSSSNSTTFGNPFNRFASSASINHQKGVHKYEEDSPMSTVDNESVASTRRATPVSHINYEAAPAPIRFGSFRDSLTHFSNQNSFGDSSHFNQSFAQWERNQAFISTASNPDSPAFPPHPQNNNTNSNLSSGNHQVSIAPDEFSTYDYDRY